MKVSRQVTDGQLAASELVLTENGAVYHLNLHPDQIASNIIVVGDQGRVEKVSKYFDHVDHRVTNREFVTHTGRIGTMPVSAMSTGIGTDNIDIVLNELDALLNIDLQNRTILPEHTSLNIVRLGTSGALQPDLGVDQFLLSTHGLGLDQVLNYYQCEFEEEEMELRNAFLGHANWPQDMGSPYVAAAGKNLFERIDGPEMNHGITATACGFYGPQGRMLRIPTRLPRLNEQLSSFAHRGYRITNFEMETSALYGLGGMLGHQTATVCTIIANRMRMEFSRDYHAAVDRMIRVVLERLTSGY
ncbi:MAG: phosphorylase [Cryomorphaceae bacterium]|nr:MAG: phosphorylase [Cryomorphaceae bacterium]